MNQNMLNTNIKCLVECPLGSYVDDCPFKKLKQKDNLLLILENYIDDINQQEADFNHHLECLKKRMSDK